MNIDEMIRNNKKMVDGMMDKLMKDPACIEAMKLEKQLEKDHKRIEKEAKLLAKEKAKILKLEIAHNKKLERQETKDKKAKLKFEKQDNKRLIEKALQRNLD